MAFLEALNAPDFGILIAGEDFAATQTMDQEYRQNVTYQGAFGTDGPVLRSVRGADENTLSMSAILLKAGVLKGMNDEDKLRELRDFEVLIRRGSGYRKVHREVNWTRVAIAHTLDNATLSADFSVPGFVRAP